MSTITIGSETWTFEQIRENESPCSHVAWQFCRDWLNEETEFTLHTSGSTGKPKPINILRKQMVASANNTIKALGLEENDRFLVCINTAFIGGKMMLVRGLELGANLVVVEPSGNPLAEISENEKYDFVALVPLQLQNIMAQNANKKAVLNKMKAVIVGGAPVSKGLEREIGSLDCPIYSTYGMTETVSHIALKRLNGNEKSDFFEVLPNVEVSKNEVGCLVIRSEVTNNEKIITNDLVEFISPTKFRWLGRADNILNTGGIKVQLEEIELQIEQLLTELEVPLNFAIIPISDEKLGQKIVLFLETESLGFDLKHKILSLSKQQLGKFKSPKEIRILRKFPLTSSGKIDRKEMGS